MSSNTLRIFAGLVCLWAPPAGAQVMGSYPYPSFIAGTTAVGEQVTANFNSIKSAVNAYDAVIRAYADSKIPSGMVSFFNLGACPSGWHALDGSGGFVDARGVFVRSLNTTGIGYDPSRTLATVQTPQTPVHTHNYALAVAQFAPIDSGLGSAVNGITYSNTETAGVSGASLPAGTTAGNDLRPANIAFLLCQKT